MTRAATRWAWHACDLKTGRILAELPARSNGALGSMLCGAGSGTLTLPLTDRALPVDWWQATLPARTVLALDHDGSVVWAGIVWSRKLTQDPAAELACASVESYLDRRYVGRTWVFEGADQHHIARMLLREAGRHGIEMRVDTAGDAGVRRKRLTYTRSADQRIGEQLAALHELPSGPEWSIRTTWGHDAEGGRRLEHTLVVRTPYVGNVLADPPVVFEYPGAITGFELVENTSDGTYANVVTAGSKDTTGKRVMSEPGIAEDTLALDRGAALIEYRHTSGHTTLAGVNAAAEERLALLRSGSTTLAVTLHSEHAQLGDWGLGDTCRIRLRTPWLSGIYDRVWRITGTELDPAAGTIAPTLSPLGQALDSHRTGNP